MNPIMNKLEEEKILKVLKVILELITTKSARKKELFVEI